VRRVDQTSRSSSGFGSFSFKSGDVISFRCDTRDNGDPSLRSSNIGFDQFGLLIGSESSPLASVTENKDGFDVGESEEELTDSMNSFVVDSAFGSEWSNSSWGEAAKVEPDRSGGGGTVGNVTESDRSHYVNWIKSGICGGKVDNEGLVIDSASLYTCTVI
jgi:hypothetical protein